MKIVPRDNAQRPSMDANKVSKVSASAAQRSVKAQSDARSASDVSQVSHGVNMRHDNQLDAMFSDAAAAPRKAAAASAPNSAPSSNPLPEMPSNDARHDGSVVKSKKQLKKEKKAEKKKKKKKRLFSIWQIIGIVISFGLLCYPMFAEVMSSTKAHEAIEDYTYSVERRSPEEINYLFANAHAWNDALSGTPSGYTERILPYEEQIEPGGIAFAWMEMPSLGENLPIYHGVGDDELQSGVGHLPTSSLPVGGDNTHAILMGHSGMPGSRMFDDIENLDNGDKIIIHVLNDVFAYEVDSKTVVWPEEVNNLTIEKGKDQITLVTCTPYGVNDHRLLVNAHRVPYDDTTPTVIKAPPDPEGIMSVMFNRRTFPIWIGFGVLVLFFTGLGITKLVRRRKRKKKQKKEQQQYDKE